MFYILQVKCYPVQGVKYVLNIQINIKMHKDYNSLGFEILKFGVKGFGTQQR